MDKEYLAHIKENGESQTVLEHCRNTAELCRAFALPELKELAYTLGYLHDLGKYSPQFQALIRGQCNDKPEHSLDGALYVRNCSSKPADSLWQMLLELCILGHHTGIPDCGGRFDISKDKTLKGRLKRAGFTADYSPYIGDELPAIDGAKINKYITDGCSNMNEQQLKAYLCDKIAFLTRYLFSCLTDADSLDTRLFCEGEALSAPSTDFAVCLSAVNERLQSFKPRTALQCARSKLQKQAFDKAAADADIYLLNMPTGSGKTLCSIKLALERALKGSKKRIIYVIPYNSIIDQTVNEFEQLFGANAQILRHQSSFSYEAEGNSDEDSSEDYRRDYRQAMKYASENWDADFIITTAVQFFESVYGNKRSRLRKLHNMADSIIIFDEIHLLPTDYLQPCLEAVVFITKYLHSEALFMTATMPDFGGLLKDYALDVSMLELVNDKRSFEHFKKCEYKSLGQLEDEALLAYAQEQPSALIIVNRKKKAQELYRMAGGRKYHLSTYMTMLDRRRVIDEIKAELSALLRDYPDMQAVPPERRILVISTSLIEAGVDLDFAAVFRQQSGLDSVLQAGGRCNREGLLPKACTYIFDLFDERSGNDKTELLKGIMSEFEQVDSVEAVNAYYERFYRLMHEAAGRKAIHRAQNGSIIACDAIPFRSYSEQFRIIDNDWQESVFVPRDGQSRQYAELLRMGIPVSSRKLQPYICTVSRRELQELQQRGMVKAYNGGVFSLEFEGAYNERLGINLVINDFYIEGS